MFGTILQRMILGELVRVFFLALISLTGMFLLGGVVSEAAQRGLSPSQVLMIIPLLIPLALRGVRFRAATAESLFQRNLWIYGVGGLIAPFIGIKLIDLAIAPLMV